MSKLLAKADAVKDLNDLVEMGYLSKQTIRKEVLRQSDEEIEKIKQEIEDEKEQEPMEEEE